jgi:hypothetical protein
MTIAKMRANPIQRLTHECQIVNGRGLHVLPRVLPTAGSALPFSSYRGLVSRAPTRSPTTADAGKRGDGEQES